jgi:hypothetical protein
MVRMRSPVRFRLGAYSGSYIVVYSRPVGQVVKTPPFHGGNRGSSPLRVIIISRGGDKQECLSLVLEIIRCHFVV